MNKLPEEIVEKIYLESKILHKKEVWDNVHTDIKNNKKKSIKCVVNKNGILYRYITTKYKLVNYQYTLPKLRTGEQFYSAGYALRIADVDWDSLPLLEVNESEIVNDV